MIRTINIKTIARIITPFTESLSLPNIMGMGPIRRTPALRVFPELPLDRNARRIIAAKAKINPQMISTNPISVADGTSKSLTPQNNSGSVANFNSSRFFCQRTPLQLVIVYKPAESTSKISLRRSEISWTSDPKNRIQAENLP